MDYLSTQILVVTIVKDDLPGLIQTVKSVQSQAYEPKHHFLVIAKMDPLTQKFLDEFEGQISWVSEVDNSLYDAMNKWTYFKEGFELISWLNAGDIFSDVDTLTYVVEDFNRNQWNWFFGNMIMDNEIGGVITKHIQTPYRKILLELGIRWIPFSSTFLTRDFLEKVGPYRTDMGVGADQEFFIRAAQLSSPSTSHRILSRMKAGGTHSYLTGFRRERDWQEFRRVNGVYFLKSKFLDSCLLPILLCVRTLSRHKFARLLGLGKWFTKKWEL